jgi:hypothetical protein
MKKHRESATAFLRKHHPVLKASLDYIWGLISKEVRFIILAMMTGGLFTLQNCRHNALASKVESNAVAVTNNTVEINSVERYISP